MDDVSQRPRHRHREISEDEDDADDGVLADELDVHGDNDQDGTENEICENAVDGDEVSVGEVDVELSSDQDDEKDEGEEEASESAEPSTRQVDPAEVPHSGRFFMHDNRSVPPPTRGKGDRYRGLSSADEQEQYDNSGKRQKYKIWEPKKQSDGMWKHDKFGQNGSSRGGERPRGRRGRRGRERGQKRERRIAGVEEKYLNGDAERGGENKVAADSDSAVETKGVTQEDQEDRRDVKDTKASSTHSQMRKPKPYGVSHQQKGVYDRGERGRRGNHRGNSVSWQTRGGHSRSQPTTRGQQHPKRYSEQRKQQESTLASKQDTKSRQNDREADKSSVVTEDVSVSTSSSEKHIKLSARHLAEDYDPSLHIYDAYPISSASQLPPMNPGDGEAGQIGMSGMPLYSAHGPPYPYMPDVPYPGMPMAPVGTTPQVLAYPLPVYQGGLADPYGNSPVPGISPPLPVSGSPPYGTQSPSKRGLSYRKLAENTDPE